ncbi:MAG: DUF177 domain-containing protein [Bacteroidota bacterium]|nr:DUF177 domain-containing protein [Bacteroidota bacterium]
MNTILSNYNIPISKQNESFSIDYEVKDDFFKELEQELIKKGNLKVNLVAKQTNLQIDCVFTIGGTIELICDRSLKPFDFSINKKATIIFKFGDRYEEISDNVIIIDRNQTSIDISSIIFDFIGLEIPMKKLHPEFQKIENDDLNETDTLIYTTSADDDSSGKDLDILDPRWEILKKLKDTF